MAPPSPLGLAVSPAAPGGAHGPRMGSLTPPCQVTWVLSLGPLQPEAKAPSGPAQEPQKGPRGMDPSHPCSGQGVERVPGHGSSPSPRSPAARPVLAPGGSSAHGEPAWGASCLRAPSLRGLQERLPELRVLDSPRSLSAPPAPPPCRWLGIRPWEEPAPLPWMPRGPVGWGCRPRQLSGGGPAPTLGSWAWGGLWGQICSPAYLLEASRFMGSEVDSAGKGEVWLPGPVGGQVGGRVLEFTWPAPSCLRGAEGKGPGPSGGCLTAGSLCPHPHTGQGRLHGAVCPCGCRHHVFGTPGVWTESQPHLHPLPRGGHPNRRAGQCGTATAPATHLHTQAARCVCQEAQETGRRGSTGSSAPGVCVSGTSHCTQHPCPSSFA